MWKDITEYKRPYRINELGEVQYFYQGKWRALSPQLEGHRAYVILIGPNGRKKVGVFRLLDRYFRGGYADKHDLCIGPKNGVKSDCTLENMRYRTRSEIGRKSMSKTARKCVVRYDRFGEPVLYKSVGEAAEKNGMTRQALDRRLYHGVLDPRGYRWEILK